MRSHSSRGTYESEEALRNVWLARGLRAVAAALVVGGIVLAAFDGDVPSIRISPFEAPTGHRAPGTTAPNAITPASGAAGADEPDLNRVDNGMEYQG
jgi:hypothetical protein